MLYVNMEAFLIILVSQTSYDDTGAEIPMIVKWNYQVGIYIYTYNHLSVITIS